MRALAGFGAALGRAVQRPHAAGSVLVVLALLALVGTVPPAATLASYLDDRVTDAWTPSALDGPVLSFLFVWIKLLPYFPSRHAIIFLPQQIHYRQFSVG